MDAQIWTKSEEKWAYILMLRGPQVHRLKVTGNVLTLKRNLQNVLEALQQGQDPEAAGAKSVEALDARTIGKAEVSPDKDSLTLHGEGDSPKSLSFATADKSAGEVLDAILAQSGRTFQPKQEEIGVVEAVLPPAIVGGIGGLFWMGLYDSATKMAAGETVEAGGRRKGLQQIMIGVAEALGTGGTIAVGVALLALIVGWAAMRIVKRPERTVWRPEPA